jgi:hypothetical protein
MSLAQDLQAWLAQFTIGRAQPAERAEPSPEPGCASCAGCARMDEGLKWPGVPEDVLAWGDDPAGHYLERMAVGEELGMDPAEADKVARREALRVACGLPWSSWPPIRHSTRGDDFMARAVGMFGPRTPAGARPAEPEPPQFAKQAKFPPSMPCPAAPSKPVITP